MTRVLDSPQFRWWLQMSEHARKERRRNVSKTTSRHRKQRKLGIVGGSSCAVFYGEVLPYSAEQFKSTSGLRAGFRSFFVTFSPFVPHAPTSAGVLTSRLFSAISGGGGGSGVSAEATLGGVLGAALSYGGRGGGGCGVFPC